MSATTHDEAQNALLKAVSWLLRPLLRLLIEKGIGYPQLRDLLKRLYVEVAEESFALEGKPPSDSRLYILTGVHRKDIKRLRAGNEPDPAAVRASTLGGAIVSHWLGLPAYQDADGQPRCLPRSSDDPAAPGFDTLVADVSKDVRPRAILDELLRQGVVTLNPDGDICLNRSAFVPGENFEEKTFFLGRHVHDHLAACAHNMLSPEQPMLERSVYFAKLSPGSVEELRTLAEKQAVAALQAVNERALALQQADQGKTDAINRIRFGCYWYQAQRKSKEDSTP